MADIILKNTKEIVKTVKLLVFIDALQGKFDEKLWGDEVKWCKEKVISYKKSKEKLGKLLPGVGGMYKTYSAGTFEHNETSGRAWPEIKKKLSLAIKTKK